MTGTCHNLETALRSVLADASDGLGVALTINDLHWAIALGERLAHVFAPIARRAPEMWEQEGGSMLADFVDAILVEHGVLPEDLSIARAWVWLPMIAASERPIDALH